MKRKGTQRFLPYEADYSLLKTCRNWENIGLGSICFCSVLLPVLNFFSENLIVKAIYTGINLIYFIIILRVKSLYT